MAADFMHMDAGGYEIAYKHFVSQLTAFHDARSGPFKGRPPLLGGRPIDLYYLYQKVISLGGLATVTAKGRWPEVVCCFDLPSGCTNAAFAVRQHYTRFLEGYERVHFLGEDERDVSLDDITGGYAGPETDLSVRHNIRGSFPERRSSSNATARPPPATVALPTFGPSTVELKRLRLSLRCGLANEAEVALNACLLISHSAPGKLALSKMADVLPAMLAHAGFYDEDIVPEVEGHWNAEHCRRLGALWRNTVATAARPLLTTLRGCGGERPFPGGLVQPGAHDWATRRVHLVATVLRNCADHTANAQHLAASELFSCFSATLLCCRVPLLRHVGEELAVITGEHFLLDKGLPHSDSGGVMSLLHPPTKSSMTPSLAAQQQRCSSKRRAWQAIAFDMVLSRDRCTVVHGLQLLASLCRANDDATVAALLPAPCLKQVYSLLAALDVQLLVSALDALLSLAELGQLSATLLCSRPGSVRQLVALLTMNVEASMPQHALDAVVLRSEVTECRLLDRTDGDGIAKAWLQAFYEPQAGHLCSRNQIYNEYAMHCAMKVQPAVALLQPTQFWNCLSSVYPGLHAIGLSLPGSTVIADMHLRGVHRRATPRPLPIAPPAPGVQVISSIVVSGNAAAAAAARTTAGSSGRAASASPATQTFARSSSLTQSTQSEGTRHAVAAASPTAQPHQALSRPAILSSTPRMPSAPRAVAGVVSKTTTPSPTTPSDGLLSANWIQQQLTGRPPSSSPGGRMAVRSPLSPNSTTAVLPRHGASPLSPNSTTAVLPRHGASPLLSQHSASSASQSIRPADTPVERSSKSQEKPSAIGAIATSTLAQLYQQQQKQRLQQTDGPAPSPGQPVACVPAITSAVQATAANQKSSNPAIAATPFAAPCTIGIHPRNSSSVASCTTKPSASSTVPTATASTAAASTTVAAATAASTTVPTASTAATAAAAATSAVPTSTAAAASTTVPATAASTPAASTTVPATAASTPAASTTVPATPAASTTVPATLAAAKIPAATSAAVPTAVATGSMPVAPAATLPGVTQTVGQVTQAVCTASDRIAAQDSGDLVVPATAPPSVAASNNGTRPPPSVASAAPALIAAASDSVLSNANTVQLSPSTSVAQTTSSAPSALDVKPTITAAAAPATSSVSTVDVATSPLPSTRPAMSTSSTWSSVPASSAAPSGAGCVSAVPHVAIHSDRKHSSNGGPMSAQHPPRAESSTSTSSTSSDGSAPCTERNSPTCVPMRTAASEHAAQDSLRFVNGLDGSRNGSNSSHPPLVRSSVKRQLDSDDSQLPPAKRPRSVSPQHAAASAANDSSCSSGINHVGMTDHQQGKPAGITLVNGHGSSSSLTSPASSSSTCSPVGDPRPLEATKKSEKVNGMHSVVDKVPEKALLPCSSSPQTTGTSLVRDLSAAQPAPAPSSSAAASTGAEDSSNTRDVPMECEDPVCPVPASHEPVPAAVKPSWKFSCHLSTCQFGCDDERELRRHIVAQHVAVIGEHSPGRCQWRGCVSTVHRSATNMRCHIVEHILSLEAEPQRFSSPGVRTIQHVSLEPTTPLAREPTEYALSGTVRLTAALVLLNLARNAPAARQRLRQYEDHFIQLASVESEAALTLAKCLGELQNK